MSRDGSSKGPSTEIERRNMLRKVEWESEVAVVILCADTWCLNALYNAARNPVERTKNFRQRVQEVAKNLRHEIRDGQREGKAVC
jgi:hypothetical protein